MHHFTEAETAAVREAVRHLDALWKLDADRGLRDSLEGGEYWHQSPAARLREMLGEASPYALDSPPFTLTTE